jgi:hypothetical protein
LSVSSQAPRARSRFRHENLGRQTKTHSAKRDATPSKHAIRLLGLEICDLLPLKRPKNLETCTLLARFSGLTADLC